MDDPITCCEDCGVVPPSTLYTDRGADCRDHDLTSPTHATPHEEDETVVRFCFAEMPLFVHLNGHNTQHSGHIGRKYQTELMVEIYSKSLVRAIGIVLCIKFS